MMAKGGTLDKPTRPKARGSEKSGRTRADVSEKPSRTGPGVVGRPSSLLSRGVFELVVPRAAEPRVKLKDFMLSAEASRVFTLEGNLSAASKTLGPFDGTISHDETGELIATLDDVSVTVTKMTGQQGQSFLMYSVEYFATSHGWRTGLDKYGPGPYGTPQEVLFQNGAGGTMHTWVTEPPFLLACGDHRKYYRHMRAEHHVFGWFDDWAKYTQYIHGPFFRC